MESQFDLRRMAKQFALHEWALKFSQLATYAVTLMHHFLKVMYLNSRLSAGFMVQNLIYAPEKRLRPQL
jgi:hypothetical protein